MVKRYNLDNDGEYVRYSDYAALKAENARLKEQWDHFQKLVTEHRKELEAEIERLTSDVAHWQLTADVERQKVEFRDKRAAEALSRTGAVKVGLERAAEIVLAQIDSKPDWTPEQEKELRGHDPVATARSAARVAIRQCHRAILSALEPAAPEGGQEAVAWQWRTPTGKDTSWQTCRSETEKNAFAEMPGVEVRPLYTRPSKQAVTADWQRVDDALISCAGLLKTLCRDEIGDTAAAELEYVRSVVGHPSEQAVTKEQRGKIAYALTKRLVIDMPTARAAVDEALKAAIET